MTRERRLHGLLAASILALLAGFADRAPAVVINEIHYQPAEGDELQFIELYNPETAPAALGGWAFIAGIRYRFAADAVIPGGGYLVLCRHPDVVAAVFGVPAASLVAWGGSSLADTGEEIVLADAGGHVVDAVAYDNFEPWDPRAAGGGPSLQRRCATALSVLPGNWSAEGQPTPLAAGQAVLCPPPEPPHPRVAINEIYYHARNDLDARHEFVELLNTTDEGIDLQGWCFSQGIGFCFAESTVLAPGEFLLVCRNQDEARNAFRDARLAGNFDGQLANDGERVTLLDEKNDVVDSVRYGDAGGWPVGADGLGFSLERISPSAPSDDPASWMDSGAVDRQVEEGWQTATASGVATSDQLFIYIGGTGEFLIDNMVLVNLAAPETNLLANGGFDAGIEGWEARGNHVGSRWSQAPGGERFEDACLHLVSSGVGSSTSSVRTTTVSPLDRSADVSYRLTFNYRHLRGSTALVARFSIATPSRGIYFALSSEGGPVTSAGKANIVLRSTLPPFIDDVRRSLREPTAADAVAITARVREPGAQSQEAPTVTLLTTLGAEARELPMLDDGRSRDGAAGDGVYGVLLPAQPHNTAVTFQIRARSARGERLSPPRTDPAQAHGYYVNDNQPPSELPVYTMILPTTNARTWLASLDCSTYRPCSLAYRGDLYPNVGIRRRGGSVCGDPAVIKKYLKIRFNRGHEFAIHDGYEFEPHKNLNFQSLWTDKALIREHISYDAFYELGQPDLTHDYVRLHANGEYFGLYAAMERPDARWLDRVGLNPEGNLYKATASREEANGTYEKKTNESDGNADLVDFLGTMHRTARPELARFFEERTDADSIIDYQLAQVIINNRDYPHKNHYLYHDTARGKWMVTPWDLDLTFGKYWDGSNGGVLNDRMDNPGITPWYTTSVRGGGLENHLLDKFFAQAGTWFRRAYLVRLWSVIAERYTMEFYEEKIDRLHDLLLEEQADDIAVWRRSPATANDRTAPAEFEPNLDRVRQHLMLRRDYLVNYLRTTERFGGFDRLKITEVMYNPFGSDDTEFLELWNNSGRAISIAGWTVEGLEAVDPVSGARSEFYFPEGAALEADEVFILAKDPAAFRTRYPGVTARIFGPYPGNLANEGEALRVKDAGPEHPATVDLLRYGNAREWPVAADGFGSSLELTAVAPDRDNDLGANWRASPVPGGSPGVVEGLASGVRLFRRGDVNADRNLDQTDAVFVLSYIFAVGAPPPCLKAADADGSGVLQVTDAVYILNYLFFNGPDPAAPFTECGRGAPDDRLACDAYAPCQ